MMRPGTEVRACTASRSFTVSESRGIDAQRRVPCKRIEVGITVQNGQVNPDDQRADQTVHEDANGLAPTAAMAIKGGRLIEVAGLHRNQRGTRDESPQIAPMLLVPCSGEQLHTNCITRREVGVEEFADVGCTPVIPCRGGTRPKRTCQRGPLLRPRISLRSPSQPAPRIRRASSRLNGSDASDRSAKSTASRLVAKWYRFMTAAQAASSTSTLVRAMH